MLDIDPGAPIHSDVDENAVSPVDRIEETIFSMIDKDMDKTCRPVKVCEFINHYSETHSGTFNFFMVIVLK